MEGPFAVANRGNAQLVARAATEQAEAERVARHTGNQGEVLAQQYLFDLDLILQQQNAIESLGLVYAEEFRNHLVKFASGLARAFKSPPSHEIERLRLSLPRFGRARDNSCEQSQQDYKDEMYFCVCCVPTPLKPLPGGLCKEIERRLLTSSQEDIPRIKIQEQAKREFNGVAKSWNESLVKIEKIKSTLCDFQVLLALGPEEFRKTDTARLDWYKQMVASLDASRTIEEVRTELDNEKQWELSVAAFTTDPATIKSYIEDKYAHYQYRNQLSGINSNGVSGGHSSAIYC